MRFWRRPKPDAEQPAWDAHRFLLGFIDSSIASGLRTYGEVAADLSEMVADEGGNARLYLGELNSRWDARLREQAAWTRPSDSDRLQAAFADLETSGLAARMNFSCCGTCAPGEIAEDVEDDPTRRGYVYFHQQDGERVAEGSVFLGYGSLSRFATPDGTPDQRADERAAVAIGREVVDSLRAHGLLVTWDGSVERRINVELPDWRRPLGPR